MKRNLFIISFSFCCVVTLSCNVNDKFENLLNDPSSPTTDKASIDFYLNHVQISFRNFWGKTDKFTSGYPSMTEFGSELTRMEAMANAPTYSTAYEPSDFNAVWDEAYRGVINHTNTLTPLAKGTNLTMHIGIATVLKAYTLMSLVDYFGDVPYSEAAQGSANTNPKTDKGEDVYKAAVDLLDTAITYLNTTPNALPATDLFYNGDASKWITLAKTLKLRAYLTTRLVNPDDAKAKIDALLAENDLIDTDAEEFVFRYGTQLDNPVSRHPKYADNYQGAATQDFLGTYFLWALTADKGVADPRTRYYTYRQRTTSTGWDAQQLPCGVKAPPAHYPTGMPFCILDNGYWGRDHGNDEGVPQDNEKRTTYGVYFAGGRFDNSDNESVNLDQGAKGQGIHPIWMASFTEFLKSEAALTLGTAGDPRALLQNGVQKSIERVLAFPAQVGVTVPETRVPTPAQIGAYVTIVLNRYDAADADGKLNIIIKEWYLALWGNGIDAYNNYRRTGKPSDMQLPIDGSPGPFVRSFWYPSIAADLNSNMEQKTDVAAKVFWDKNPDPLK